MGHLHMTAIQLGKIHGLMLVINSLFHTWFIYLRHAMGRLVIWHRMLYPIRRCGHRVNFISPSLWDNKTNMFLFVCIWWSWIGCYSIEMSYYQCKRDFLIGKWIVHQIYRENTRRFIFVWTKTSIWINWDWLILYLIDYTSHFIFFLNLYVEVMYIQKEEHIEICIK